MLAVPLGLWISRRLDLWAVTVLFAAASFFVDAPSSALVALPYLGWVLWLAVRAGLRLLRRGVWQREALVDLGEVYLLVGAAWLVAARTGEVVLGFDAAITALTAVHFHFAGFAAATVAGVVSRIRPIPAWVALCVALGPPLVGLGFVTNTTIEVSAAVALAVGMLGLAWAMARAHWTLALPGIVLVGTMALAITWAVQSFLGLYLLTIPGMAQSHGIANVLGFALPALMLLAWRRPPVPELVELSAVPSFGEETPGPSGLYARPEDLGLVGLPAPIAAYFCDSANADLSVSPTWRWLWVGRWSNALGRRVGNFVLPLEPVVLEHRVSSVAAGWVRSRRSYPDGGPMLVLNYVLEQGRMRAVADVLPGLRLDFFFETTWDGDELSVESTHTHLRLGSVLVRIPLEERLTGRLEDGLFLAHQRIVVAGIEVLSLRYRIGPRERL